MKFLISLHIYLLFMIGGIVCLVGILIMLGVSQILSGILPATETAISFFGKSLLSIASGSVIFVQGVFINCFSLTMWMLQKIAFRLARVIKPFPAPVNQAP